MWYYYFCRKKWNIKWREVSIVFKTLVAQLVKIRLQCRRPHFNSWVRKICCRRDKPPTPVFSGFPCGSAGKESACNAGDLGLIPGLGRSPGEGKGYLLQYSGLENSMDCIVQGVAKSWMRLSNFHFTSNRIYSKNTRLVQHMKTN